MCHHITACHILACSSWKPPLEKNALRHTSSRSYLKNDQPHRQLETRKEENVLSRKQRRPHLTRAPRKEVAREVGRSSTVSSTAPRRISALSPICHQVGGTIGCNAPSIEKGKCVSALLRTEQGQRFNGVIHLTESELDLVKVS